MSDPGQFLDYIRAIADRLGLRDWTFRLSPDRPADSHVIAGIECWEGRKRATVMLSDTFLEGTPQDQRQTICHELIHCHFDAAARIAEGGPRAMIPAFRLALEFGVDAMADAIAPFMPLPGRGRKKARAR